MCNNDLEHKDCATLLKQDELHIYVYTYMHRHRGIPYIMYIWCQPWSMDFSANENPIPREYGSLQKLQIPNW